MNLFGIGLPELLFILVLILIIFGPKEIQKTGKTIGKELNRMIRSDTWRTINQARRELGDLPNRLMRESGMDEIQEAAKRELSETASEIQEAVSPTEPSRSSPPPPTPAEKIQPPETGQTK